MTYWRCGGGSFIAKLANLTSLPEMLSGVLVASAGSNSCGAGIGAAIFWAVTSMPAVFSGKRGSGGTDGSGASAGGGLLGVRTGAGGNRISAVSGVRARVGMGVAGA